MKTTTDLFLAFTKDRTPTYTNGSDVCFPNAKFFFISEKQSRWLSNLIFKKASGIKGGELHSTEQYIETIGEDNYCLIVGKRTRRIRITNYNK